MILYFVLKLMLILQGTSLAVKIGVSKINSTMSVTTIEPNTSVNEPDTTENLIPSATATLNAESSTIAAVITEDDLNFADFPPKLGKGTTTKQRTTSAPLTTTEIFKSNDTASNLNWKTFTISSANENFSSFSNDLYCSCDFMPSKCDVNCCCDRDCGKDILKVFDCLSPATYPRLRKLLASSDFEYEHGLPSCKVNDGWFCVFRTNTRPSVKKAYHFDFDTKNNYKLPYSLMELTEVVPKQDRDFYKYGDILKIFNMESLDMQNLEIPFDFKPPFCQLSDPVRHLIPISRNCLLTSLAAAQEKKAQFLNIFSRARLLSRPKFHLSDSDDIKHHTTDFQLKTCTRNNGVKDCIELSVFSNETEIRETDNFYVSEILIKIVHNYTDLLECYIEFMEEELLINEDSIEIWQKYDVLFTTPNETESEPNNIDSRLGFSGPLGYLQGEPIIVSKYIAVNESEEISAQNQVLNYFKSSNMINNTLSLLSQKSGLCQKKYSKQFTINYGISSLSQCRLRIDKETLLKTKNNSLKKANMTHACIILQEKISQMLFNNHAVEQLNHLTELHVSMLGRPKNSSNEWLSLQVQNLNFAPISGHLVLNSKTLICRNILLSAAYEFHIGVFTERSTGIARQALVKNSVLKLGPRHDLEFQLNERLEVPLTLTVMFYDLSSNNGSFDKRFGSIIVYLVLTIIKIYITY